jgi:hypothetical protein
MSFPGIFFIANFVSYKIAAAIATGKRTRSNFRRKSRNMQITPGDREPLENQVFYAINGVRVGREAG